mgnify:CR=1 FL=1
MDIRKSRDSRSPFRMAVCKKFLPLKDSMSLLHRLLLFAMQPLQLVDLWL